MASPSRAANPAAALGVQGCLSHRQRRKARRTSSAAATTSTVDGTARCVNRGRRSKADLRRGNVIGADVLSVPSAGDSAIQEEGSVATPPPTVPVVVEDIEVETGGGATVGRVCSFPGDGRDGSVDGSGDESLSGLSPAAVAKGDVEKIIGGSGGGGGCAGPASFDSDPSDDASGDVIIVIGNGGGGCVEITTKMDGGRAGGAESISPAPQSSAGGPAACISASAGGGSCDSLQLAKKKKKKNKKKRTAKKKAAAAAAAASETPVQDTTAEMSGKIRSCEDSWGPPGLTRGEEDGGWNVNAPGPALTPVPTIGVISTQPLDSGERSLRLLPSHARKSAQEEDVKSAREEGVKSAQEEDVKSVKEDGVKSVREESVKSVQEKGGAIEDPENVAESTDTGVKTNSSYTTAASPPETTSGPSGGCGKSMWGNCSTKVSFEERSRRSRTPLVVGIAQSNRREERVRARPAPFPEESWQPGGGFLVPEDSDDRLPPPSAYEVQETAYMLQVYQEMMQRLQADGMDEQLPNGFTPKIYDFT